MEFCSYDSDERGFASDRGVDIIGIAIEVAIEIETSGEHPDPDFDPDFDFDFEDPPQSYAPSKFDSSASIWGPRAIPCSSAEIPRPSAVAVVVVVDHRHEYDHDYDNDNERPRPIWRAALAIRRQRNLS